MNEAARRTATKVPIIARAPLAFLIFLLVILALQGTSFGDTNRHADEIFYVLVGQRMHDGLLPYVDVWDRKPFGLFAIYYLIAGISRSVWCYQIVACLFAAATALVISRLVTRLSGWRGGLVAGLAYAVVVLPFEGASGQSPDFYNLLIAGAALLVVTEMKRIAQVSSLSWRGWLAMGLCGLAITVKQTTLFESVFLGLSLFAAHQRTGASPTRTLRIAAICATIGALPTVAISLAYAIAGHWPEYWHAMVLSNFAREPAAGGELATRALGLFLRLAVLAPVAVAGIAGAEARVRRFLIGWLVAGLVGFFGVPAFSVHYVLPLLVPLSVAAGLFFDRARLCLPLFVALALCALFWSPPDHRSATRASVAAMDELAREVERHDGGGGLLVYDGPSYLYALTGKPFLTLLVFPYHLNHDVEKDVSHIRTDAEVDRVLAGMPGVIVMSRWPRNHPVNAYTRARVLSYARENCRSSRTVALPEGAQVFEMVLRGDCGVAAR